MLKYQEADVWEQKEMNKKYPEIKEFLNQIDFIYKIIMSERDRNLIKIIKERMIRKKIY